jgi:pentatricopeptide repeat protein
MHHGKMWEHQGCLESVQQDAIWRCDHLNCHDIGTRNAAKGRRHWIYFGKCNRKVCSQTLTFVGVLNSCVALGALGDSRIVHEQLIQTGCNSDVFVGNSLLDMYTKCGSLEDALRVFKNMPSQDVSLGTP